jgi:hypothetical protein
MPLRLKWKDGEYKPTSAGLLSISGTTDESCMDDTLPRLAAPLAILSGTGSSSESKRPLSLLKTVNYRESLEMACASRRERSRAIAFCAFNGDRHRLLMIRQGAGPC